MVIADTIYSGINRSEDQNADRQAITFVRAGEKPCYLLRPGISQTSPQEQRPGWSSQFPGKTGWKMSMRGRDESKVKEVFMALKAAHKLSYGNHHRGCKKVSRYLR